MITTGIDHIAVTVPNFDEQVERLTGSFGMIVQSRTDSFAVILDPGSGLKIELGRSTDEEVHFRHLGFCADDVDAEHASLVNHGMEPLGEPQRRDFARMYTSYLAQRGGLEVQLVRYDD